MANQRSSGRGGSEPTLKGEIKRIAKQIGVPEEVLLQRAHELMQSSGELARLVKVMESANRLLRRRRQKDP